MRTLTVRSPAAESNSTSATGKPSAIAVNPLWRVTGGHDHGAYLDDEPGNHRIAERDAVDLPLF